MGFREIGLVILLASRASSTCYYRDGTIAEDDEPCPDSRICCPSGDTCMDNFLCRDQNNFANGSTVTFPGGTYNYTDLYHTSSCQSQSYDGCSIQCTTYNSDSGEYVWACDSALTSFCCHSGPDSLAQYDCCQNGTFSLASPNQGTSTGSTTLTTSSSTLSGSAASISTTADAPATTATSTIAPDPSSSLSTGAKAGIGVGVAAAVILVISLVIVLVCARRKRGKAKLGEKVLAEMPSDLSNIQEMDGTARPSELGSEEGARRVYELGS